MLITKGGETTTPSRDLFNCALACGLVLVILVKICATGGACFNPAIGFALTLYQNEMIEHDGHLTWYLWIYTVGPAVGGVIAGAFQILHASTIRKIQNSIPNKDDQKVFVEDDNEVKNLEEENNHENHDFRNIQSCEVLDPPPKENT